MKNTNTCPKCSSVAVTGPHRVAGNSNIRIMISGFKTATLDSYTCLSCGYTEFFPDEGGLENIRNQYQAK